MNDLDALTDIRPRVDRPDDAVIARARGELMARVEAVSDERPDASPRRAPRVRRLRTRAGVAVAAAVIAALVAVTISAGPRGAGGPVAAGALEPIARIAATRPAAGSGSVVYTKSVALLPDTTVSANGARTTMDRDEREIWIAPDGSGRIRETRAGVASDTRFAPGGLSYTSFAGWPTDPDAVLAKLRTQAGGSGRANDVESFVVAGDALRETGAPPELRAAIFRAITKIHGVEVLGTVRDQTGRAGLGVAITTTDGDLQVLIFDAATSALLGEQIENRNTGAVASWTAYLESRLVPAVPPGGEPSPASATAKTP